MDKESNGLEREGGFCNFEADVGHHQHQQEMNDVSLPPFLGVANILRGNHFL